MVSNSIRKELSVDSTPAFFNCAKITYACIINQHIYFTKSFQSLRNRSFYIFWFSHIQLNS